MNHFELNKARIAENFKITYGEDLSKARSGTYADNAENRNLGRVGQKYGSSGSGSEGDKKDSGGMQEKLDKKFLNLAKNSKDATEFIKKVQKVPNVDMEIANHFSKEYGRDAKGNKLSMKQAAENYMKYAKGSGDKTNPDKKDEAKKELGVEEKKNGFPETAGKVKSGDKFVDAHSGRLYKKVASKKGESQAGMIRVQDMANDNFLEISAQTKVKEPKKPEKESKVESNDPQKDLKKDYPESFYKKNKLKLFYLIGEHMVDEIDDDVVADDLGIEEDEVTQTDKEDYAASIFTNSYKDFINTVDENPELIQLISKKLK